ncbi:hypothetical protein M404DRAFT_940631, partial [Pisolithus tinctorius Marx 270]
RLLRFHQLIRHRLCLSPRGGKRRRSVRRSSYLDPPERGKARSYSVSLRTTQTSLPSAYLIRRDFTSRRCLVNLPWKNRSSASTMHTARYNPCTVSRRDRREGMPLYHPGYILSWARTRSSNTRSSSVTFAVLNVE